MLGTCPVYHAGIAQMRYYIPVGAPEPGGPRAWLIHTETDMMAVMLWPVSDDIGSV
jgi:hypothetical protein